ncbi:MAG TPA: hypothetical protein VFD45_03115 [Patescibacteria group bacterium]|nr:hypothetical protein [Patescibacteria group bacterium]
MVEQKGNQEQLSYPVREAGVPTSLKQESNDSETLIPQSSTSSLDKRGVFGGIRKGFKRRVFAPAVIALGLGGFIGGCGDENRSTETSGQTNITQPTTGENSTTSETIPFASTTTSEKPDSSIATLPTNENVEIGSLVSVKKIMAPEVISGFSVVMQEKNAYPIESVTEVSIKNPQTDDKSVLYKVEGKRNLLVYKSNDGLDVYDPDVYVTRDYTNFKTYLQFMGNGNELMKFDIKGDIVRKQTESKDEYLNRITDLYKKMERDDETARDILKGTKSISFTISGTKDTFLIEDSGDIALMLGVLKPGEEFVQYQKEASGEITVNPPGSSLESLYLDVSIEELKKYANPPEFSPIKPGEYDIPEDLQQAYYSATGESILYVGEENEGLKLNAAITSADFKSAREVSLNPDAGERSDGFGMLYRSPEGVKLPIMWMNFEFEGLVPIANSDDFYFVFSDPIKKINVAARSDLKDPMNPTKLFINNLNKKEQNVSGTVRDYLRYQLSKGLNLTDVLKKKDIVTVVIKTSNDFTDVEKDENGIMKLFLIYLKRFEGVEDLEKLLDR